MDDKQFKELLENQEKTRTLVEKLWQAEKWRRFWTIFRYVIYIGVILGAFYFLTPYVEKLTSAVQNLQSAKSPKELQKALEKFQK